MPTELAHLAIALMRSLILHVLRLDLESGLVSMDVESATSMAFTEDNLHELCVATAVLACCFGL